MRRAWFAAGCDAGTRHGMTGREESSALSAWSARGSRIRTLLQRHYALLVFTATKAADTDTIPATRENLVDQSDADLLASIFTELAIPARIPADYGDVSRDFLRGCETVESEKR
jgi:hypothetical protein